MPFGKLSKIYFSFFTKAFSSRIQYRVEILVWVALNVIPTLVMFAVWRSILNSGSIHGYTQNTINSYYLLSLIIHGSISAYFVDQSIPQIREGKIDHYLTKPVSYFAQLFFKHSGGKAFYLLVSLPFFVYFYLLSTKSFTVQPNLESILVFLILMLMGYIFEFLTSYLLLLAAFWIEEADAVQHFKWVIMALCSGSMMPLQFLPDWLQKISYVLPFKYLYAVPINVLTSGYQTTTADWLYYGIVLVGTYMLTKIVWSNAMRVYTSAGG